MRHPNKHLQEVVDYARSKGWEVSSCSGHPWGKIRCPHGQSDGCQHFINGTPCNPVGDARRLKKLIDQGPHANEAGDE